MVLLHHDSVNEMPSDSFLVIHRRNCGCVTRVHQAVIVGCSKDELTELIIESEHIDPCDALCVSQSCITLFDKNLNFLLMRNSTLPLVYYFFWKSSGLSYTPIAKNDTS